MHDPLAAAIASAVAVSVGAGSALLPLVNAEAYAALAPSQYTGPLAVTVIVLLAAGQTAGKLVIFEAARRGTRTALTRHNLDPHRVTRKPRSTIRWTTRATDLMRSPRTGPVTVLAAATLGLPPLLLVTAAAGAAGQPRAVFAALCFAGRTLRFAAVAAPALMLRQ